MRSGQPSRRPSGRPRLRSTRLARTAASIGAASLLVLTACTEPAGPDVSVETKAPVPKATRSGTSGTYGPDKPKIPAQGAYIGAWVKPPVFTDEARLKSVLDLESRIGGQLDIVHTYKQWSEELVGVTERHFVDRGSLMMLSWAGTDTRSITMKSHDSYIREQAKAVADLRRPVLLRFRWEMNRPNLRAVVWSPADYIAAWRHTKAIFDEAGADNAAWVWCPIGENYEETRGSDYYPGDAWVDWTCVDVYPGEDLRPMTELLGPFLAFAGERGKPMMIGEFGVGRHVPGSRRASWLAESYATIRTIKNMKAVVYFDSNPEGRKPFREYAIDDDPAAVGQFRRIAADPYFNPLKLRAAR